MDWAHPLDSLVSLVTGKDSSTPAPVATPATPTPVVTGFLGPASSGTQYRYSAQTGKPIADLPKANEETIDVYPTVHSLEPTKLNGGKPWAPQKVPTGFYDGLAYAEAKAKSVGGFDDATLKQFLPLATRESRYNDYGNNGVWVDYKTPPPKELEAIIAQSDAAAAKELRFKKLGLNAMKKNQMELFDDMRLQQQLAKKEREALDEKILSNPNWESRADSYKDITDKAGQLGLKQSSNQELIRDKETGKLISKADVYRASNSDPYTVKALHVPLALYNKMHENPGAKGLKLTKTFVGGGEEAAARNAQEAQITRNLQHPKNKPVMDYYTSRYNAHLASIKKGKR